METELDYETYAFIKQQRLFSDRVAYSWIAIHKIAKCGVQFHGEAILGSSKLGCLGIETHSSYHQYDGQTQTQGCFVTGGVCYHDGTSLVDWMPDDLNYCNDVTIWTVLVSWYEQKFGKGHT